MKRHTRTEQLRHIEAWRRSGLTKPHYCQQQHIAIHNVYSWLKNSKNNHENIATIALAFIPARRIAVENTQPDTVTLNLPNGCSISCLPAQLPGIIYLQDTLPTSLIASGEWCRPCHGD
jgi:hypothetical protein